MNKIEQMKAQLEQIKMETHAKVLALVEANKLQLQINKLQSPLYITRELELEDTTRLDAIIEHIEELYAVDRRKISHTYSYGDIPNKIITICRAIMYSKIEEKAELLMLSGLHLSTIEDLLQAFGNTAYFSVRDLAVIPAIDMDIATTKELLQVCADDLGLVSTLKLHNFSANNVEYQYTRALNRAEEALENTLKYAQESQPEYEE